MNDITKISSILSKFKVEEDHWVQSLPEEYKEVNIEPWIRSRRNCTHFEISNDNFISDEDLHLLDLFLNNSNSSSNGENTYHNIDQYEDEFEDEEEEEDIDEEYIPNYGNAYNSCGILKDAVTIFPQNVDMEKYGEQFHALFQSQEFLNASSYQEQVRQAIYYLREIANANQQEKVPYQMIARLFQRNKGTIYNINNRLKEKNQTVDQISWMKFI